MTFISEENVFYMFFRSFTHLFTRYLQEFYQTFARLLQDFWNYLGESFCQFSAAREIWATRVKFGDVVGQHSETCDKVAKCRDCVVGGFSWSFREDHLGGVGCFFFSEEVLGGQGNVS